MIVTPRPNGEDPQWVYFSLDRLDSQALDDEIVEAVTIPLVEKIEKARGSGRTADRHLQCAGQLEESAKYTRVLDDLVREVDLARGDGVDLVRGACGFLIGNRVERCQDGTSLISC